VEWYIQTNASGSWITLDNDSLINGSGVISTIGSNMNSYNTLYWWSLNCTDGTFWTNETYHFMTSSQYPTPSYQKIGEYYCWGIPWFGRLHNDDNAYYTVYQHRDNKSGPTLMHDLAQSVYNKSNGTWWVKSQLLGDPGYEYSLTPSTAYFDDKYYLAFSDHYHQIYSNNIVLSVNAEN